MSPRLSIAFLSHVASRSAPTGAERSLALLAAGMRARGHRVCVVAPGDWALSPGLRDAGVDVEVIPSRPEWTTYFDPPPWPVRALKRVRELVPRAGAARLARFLEQWRPDVVHVNCLPHLAGAEAARRSGRPVVWHLREILPSGVRRRRWTARVGSLADVAVAVSGPVADWLRQDGAEVAVRTIPNGADPQTAVPTRDAARRELGLHPEGVIAGLFGQLAPHKGGLDFVQAAARVVPAHPEARFVLAGDGPRDYVRRVDEAIDRAGHPGRIVRLAAQPDAGNLLAACDLVCLTTRTPDPFPRAVLEAMAAERAVVAYRSGGTVEMVVDGETGVMVDVGNVAGLADAIARLVPNAARREALGRAGARRVRARFSVGRHLDRMESLFRELQ